MTVVAVANYRGPGARNDEVKRWCPGKPGRPIPALAPNYFKYKMFPKSEPFIPDARGDEKCQVALQSWARRATSTISRGVICRRRTNGRNSCSTAIRISRTSQRRRRIDRQAGRKGPRRPHRADRQRPPPHLQGTVGLDEPAGPCAGRELRRQAGQPGADPLRQQPRHGRLLARRHQGRCRRRQHHADAARRRTRQDRRQGGDHDRAVRHR